MTKHQVSPAVRPLPMFAAVHFTPIVPVLLAVLVFVPVCRGADQRQDASTGEKSGIAPNQSVSIDDPASPSTDEIPVSVDTEAKIATENSDVDGSVTQEPNGSDRHSRLAGHSEDATTSRAVRFTRRTARDADATARSAPVLPDVPWYRTGIGALGIVLGVIAVAVWSIRRWMPTLSGGGCSALNVVGRVGLSPKHSVALISMGRRFVLVGLSGERITPICEVTDPQEVAELTLRLGRQAGYASASRSSGKEQAFESLLSGEAEEYARAPEPTRQGMTAASGAAGWTPREPLHALLTRLRSLKLK